MWIKLRVKLKLWMILGVTVPIMLLGYLDFFMPVKWRRRYLIRLKKYWAKMAIYILGVKADIQGTPPKPPFLLASNHMGYVDILLLAANVDGVFIAKKDIKNWGMMGYLTDRFVNIFVDREDNKSLIEVGNLIRGCIERGEGVVLFGEGTSTRGECVQPFKSSLMKYPSEADFPVHYVTLGYKTPEGQPPAHLSVCWWGGMEFNPHFVEFLKLPRVDATLIFGEEPVRDTNRKRLTKKLWERVKENFVPVVQPKES